MRKSKKFKNYFIFIAFVVSFGLFVYYVKTDVTYVIDAIELDNSVIGTPGSIKQLVDCKDIPFELEKIQDGSFWVLKNYIRADHGELGCGDSITFTTHGDLTFLDNLATLLVRWQAPVSMALYAPGYDFNRTLESIQYVRNCLPESDLIQQFVTFHIYFPNNHMPARIPASELEVQQWPYDCLIQAPYVHVNRTSMYRYNHNLTYPINLGRNVARKAAITHLILACDIELYPNPGLVDQFFDMVHRNPSILYGTNPRVFPLAVFEIQEKATIPNTKTELQSMLANKTAIPFHLKVCKSCHNMPEFAKWMAANETDELDVFSVAKRTLQLKFWEPFYISDNHEPLFDERVTWEGQKNKRIQSYAMCLLNYEFHVLNNAFLIHSPGIKVFKWETERQKHVAAMNKIIKQFIVPEYKILYSQQTGCIP